MTVVVIVGLHHEKKVNYLVSMHRWVFLLCWASSAWQSWHDGCGFSCRANFNQVFKVNPRLHFTFDFFLSASGLENSNHPFNQENAKLKLIMTRSPGFSCSFGSLGVFILSSYWLLIYVHFFWIAMTLVCCFDTQLKSAQERCRDRSVVGFRIILWLHLAGSIICPPFYIVERMLRIFLKIKCSLKNKVLLVILWV